MSNKLGVKILVILFILFFSISSYAGNKVLSNFEQITENEYLKLFIKKSTAEIAVLDKKTDNIWYTNPPNRGKMEKKAKGKYKDRLNSQFMIEYLNLSNENFYMDSYNNSIIHQQHEFNKIENGIRVSYLLGEEWGPVYYLEEIETSPYLPKIMRKEKFEELILNNIESDADKEYLNDMYYTVSFKEINENFEHVNVPSLDMDKLFGNYQIQVEDERLSERDKRALIANIVHLVTRGKGYSSNAEVKSEDLSFLKEHTTYVLKGDIFVWDEEDIASIAKEAGCTPANIRDEQMKFNVPVPNNNIEVFTVALEYYLDGQDLIVRIPGNSITYPDNVLDKNFNRRETYPLASVNPLQYFGAANNEEEGYIFVPDGSGALIMLNELKNHDRPYNKKVYGKDYAIQPIEEYAGLNNTNINFPVYGLKKGDKAFLAIIEEGAPLANITAKVAGMTDSYNTVSAKFDIMPNTKIQVSSTSAENTLDINMFQARKYKGDIKIRYSFLNGAKANYNGMAQLYQNYLLDKGYLERLTDKDKNIPLYVELLGAIHKTKPVLGVPKRVEEPLTTYQDASKIINDVLNSGINNLKVKYSGWSSGGYYHRFPNKVKTEKVLGNKKEFVSLVNLLEKEGIEFFPDISLLNVYQNGILDSFNSNTEASRFLNREIAYLNSFNYATYRPEDSKSILYSPAYLDKLADDFINDYDKYNINSISLRKMGEQLNSDFRSSKEDLVDRVQAQEIISDQLKRIKNNLGTIMLSGGNEYVLPYTRDITDIQMFSGNDTIIDIGIPFYQMVLHGYINYTGTPINIADKSREYILKLIETGAYPYYKLSYKSSSTTKNSKFDHWYQVNYSDLKQQILDNYEMINQIYKDLQTERMVRHQEIAKNVYKTTYENGSSVIVNYNQKQVNIEGNMIPGRDYRFFSGRK